MKKTTARPSKAEERIEILVTPELFWAIKVYCKTAKCNRADLIRKLLCREIKRPDLLAMRARGDHGRDEPHAKATAK